jgi:peptidoglycan-associated lipoprotein
MKRLTISTILVSMVLAGGACGGKNKKADTRTTAVTPDSSKGDRQAGTTTDRDGTELDADQQAKVTDLAAVIYFEFDSTTLSQESRDALEANAEWLRADPTRRLTIEGHTDEVGTDEYNVALGERRARAAYDYLVRLGIEADRIDVISFGEERPAAPTDPENRRAMFIATSPRG